MAGRRPASASASFRSVRFGGRPGSPALKRLDNRLARAVVFGQKAIEAAEALDHPASLVMACWGLGWFSNLRGAFDQSLSLLERAHAICTKWELSSWLANVPEEFGFEIGR